MSCTNTFQTENILIWFADSQTAGDFKLRLLVEADHDHLEPTLPLVGRKWMVKDIIDPNDIPNYTCISYVWGDQNTEWTNNPFYGIWGPKRISVHTMRALESTISKFATKTLAFWIDAFCVPVAEDGDIQAVAEKQATLESMGYIYHKADKVAIVLVEESYAAIEHMIDVTATIDQARRERLVIDKSHLANAQKLDCLEKDGWIRSVWTYQEVLETPTNDLSFLCEDSSKPPLLAWVSFSAIGGYITLFKQTQQGIDQLDIRSRYPRLDAFESLIGDLWLGGEKYGLRVMASMNGRETTEFKNYWYAMIGAMTMERSARSVGATEQQLCQKFIDVCESKQDFSYIFSSADRQAEEVGSPAFERQTSTKRWRPRLGQFPAIVPIHNFGTGQKGKRNEDGTLTLHDMAVYQTSGQRLCEKAKNWMTSWIERTDYLPNSVDFSIETPDEGDPRLLIYDFLKAIGFLGSNEYLQLEDGFFFLQHAVAADAAVSVLVSTSIQYAFGAPGLARRIDDDGTSWYTPGVLFGQVFKEQELVTLT
ncbi:MAG: hypothetical protein M1834_007273 [Cirrosporium novae-zelandiae]|nr:MAG: hypothetical protein M1834_007273 [Cirrosporium novae-zelandiae]